jgi:hypothetical protein
MKGPGKVLKWHVPGVVLRICLFFAWIAHKVWNTRAQQDTCDMRRAGVKLQQLATQHLSDPALVERLLSNSHAGTSSSASLSSGTTTFARVLHLSGRLVGSATRVPAGGLLSLPWQGTTRQQRVGHLTVLLLYLTSISWLTGACSMLAFAYCL